MKGDDLPWKRLLERSRAGKDRGHCLLVVGLPDDRVNDRGALTVVQGPLQHPTELASLLCVADQAVDGLADGALTDVEHEFPAKQRRRK